MRGCLAHSLSYSYTKTNQLKIKEIMKTKIELEQSIIEITATIHQEFPELSKYISEMPSNNSDNEELNVKNLSKYYNSLENLVIDYATTHIASISKKALETDALSGIPIYPPSEDIYQQFKEESDLNPENLSKNKAPNEEEGLPNEKSFRDDMSGNDLDVPGSDLDDRQENIGSEDEENNYYSLGGDNHNDLDEDRG